MKNPFIFPRDEYYRGLGTFLAVIFILIALCFICITPIPLIAVTFFSISYVILCAAQRDPRPKATNGITNAAFLNLIEAKLASIEDMKRSFVQWTKDKQRKIEEQEVQEFLKDKPQWKWKD